MILVTGAARSGTSLVTKILQAHGAWLGQPGHVNQLYENTAIRQRILKPYLLRVGADPLGQRVLPDVARLPVHGGLLHAVRAVLMGGREGAKLAYKDAKLCLVWPAWHQAFPKAKWIVVRRKRQDIISSCERTHFMRHRTNWGEWVDQHELRFQQMRGGGLDLVEIWPSEFISDPEKFRPVCDHAGLDFDPAKVTAAIDPERFENGPR